MQLLSDAHVVGSKPDTGDGSACYYLFPSQEALDAALQLLSTTTWDAPNKELLAAARAEVTRLAGFHEAADALLAALRASRSDTAAGAGLDATPEDELDSYEALVRDAGKYWYRIVLCHFCPQHVLTKTILFLYIRLLIEFERLCMAYRMIFLRHAAMK